MPSVLEQLRDAGRAAAHAPDLGALGAVAVDAVTRLVGADRAAVRLFGDDGVLRYVAWRGLSDEYRAIAERDDTWRRFGLAPSPEPVVIPDVSAEPRLGEMGDAARAEGIGGFGFVPLVHGERILGKLLVYFDRPRALKAEELHAVEILATQVAFFTAAHRGGERARHEEEDRAFLLEASRVLAESLDVGTTLNRITALAVPRLADWCSVKLVGERGELRQTAIFDPDTARAARVTDYARRFPFTEQEAEIVRAGDPVLVADVVQYLRRVDLGDEHRASLEALGAKAAYVVPLVTRGRVLGTMNFVYAEAGRRYGEDEQRLARELAARAAMTLHNSGLLLEARAAREAVAAERERLLVTLRSIGDAVIATDAEGVLTLLNGVAEKLIGWTWEEARGRPLAEVFRAFDERTGERKPDPVAAVIREGRAVAITGHTVIESRGGVRRAISDSAAPIVAADGTRVGVVLVFRDVTTQQRMEEELARASRLESLGVLAGGIAHDFNNILTAVVTNISLAEALVGAEHAARAKLAGATRACMRARDLTRQLLTFSRGGAPVTTRVDVAALVREACGFALQGSRTAATYELPPDLWTVEADPAQFAQVLHNLVLNATQAMPEGGRIVASARNVEIAAETDLPLPPGRYVRVSVADTGPGIPTEILDRVFDPFFSTRPGGTGLGLATCHSIVRRHGGHISVSTSPAGSTFHVWLPAAGAPSSASLGAARPRAERGRVLVMDDDAELRDLACECFAHFGFQCDVTEHGAAAVERFVDARREGRPYTLVVLDLTVPGGMGGLEALRHMRAVDPHVRAVVSSGYSDDPVLARFAEHGFAAAMQKPWALPELEKVLAEVLGKVAEGV